MKKTILWFILLILTTILILLGYQFNWTGFTGRTLWDWMELALIPVVLFFLANYYSQKQSIENQYRQHKAEQFNILQTYLGRMQELVLEKKLTDHAAESTIANLSVSSIWCK